MRGLRRIADRTKYDAKSAWATGSDQSVREILGVPSLHCILLQRRLLLLASVLRNRSNALVSILSAKANDGSPLPWVRLVREDLMQMASCNADKMRELGDPLVNFDAWAEVAKSYPFEWRALVKRCDLTSMNLDATARARSASGEWGSQPVLRHVCAQCNAGFPTFKALESHKRAKHKSRTPLSNLIGSSNVCPCCHTAFSCRARLLAHVSEKRNRGSRQYSCNTILLAGLVQPPSAANLAIAFDEDKEARSAARKSGHTVPLSQSLAKRPRTGSSVLAQQISRKRKLVAGDPVAQLPENAVFLDQLRPKRRLRTKTSQELILMQHIT